MSKLVADLVKGGYLKTALITDAFLKIKRRDFVLPELENEAEENTALPIGFGQTISQPLTVAFMLELLDPQPGQNILDVGSGSGWTTALLSEIVGSVGKVTALERIGELKDFGEKNADKYGYVARGTAEFYLADGNRGFPEKAPYDRILVSAAGTRIPETLKKQLKIGGKLVMPVGKSIIYLEKKSADDFLQKEFPGFVFVPLIRE